MDGVGIGGKQICALPLLNYTSQAPVKLLPLALVQHLAFEFNQPPELAHTGVALPQSWVGNSCPTCAAGTPPSGQPKRKEAGWADAQTEIV